MEGKIHSRLINHKTMLQETTCTFNFPESDWEEEDDTLTHKRGGSVGRIGGRGCAQETVQDEGQGQG